MSKVLVIGAGYMGMEYVKVLLAQSRDLEVVGRSAEGVARFKQNYPEVLCHEGGIDAYLRTHQAPRQAIVATNIEMLATITFQLIAWGVKEVLVEKPLAYQSEELKKIQIAADKQGAVVYVAYNRRYFQSVSLARKIIEEDRGISCVHFEFTEWISRIDPNKYHPNTLRHWIIANSSHVIDLVFHLIGLPEELKAWVSGSGIAWHPSGTTFMGMGVSHKKIPFNYYSNWMAPGRWSIQISTAAHRLHFAPMEELAVQKLDSVKIEKASGDYQLDEVYKPGLFAMVEEFCNSTVSERMCRLTHLIAMLPFYRKMGNYKSN